MTRTTIVCLLSTLVLGCKETVTKPDPDTLKELDVCKKTLEEKNKLVQALQDESTRNQAHTGGEIVVVIEGGNFTVKPGPPGEKPPVDDKVAAQASKEFIDVVQRSRGSIQKCYEQALKKNTGLQSHAVTLTVSASFTNQGAYQNASFSATQPLGEQFDSCMKTVASKWQLPQSSPAMTFKTQVSLTPS